MKKFLYVILTAFLVAIIGVGGLYLYKNRNAETIIPDTEITADVTAFCQSDERWAEDNLGDSKYKMGDSGCLTTCITSIILMQDIEVNELSEINPKTVNEYFSQNGVYDSEGDLTWSVAGDLLGREFIRNEALEKEEIQSLIENKNYPIVLVKTSSGNYHFVLLVGADENSFLCMDPLNKNGELVSLAKYDDKIYSVTYCE